MPKVKSRKNKKKVRHDPLYKQMTDDPGYLKAPKSKPNDEDADFKSTTNKHTHNEEDDSGLVESNWVTQRVLETVREQQMDIQREENKNGGSAAAASSSSTQNRTNTNNTNPLSAERNNADSDSEVDEGEDVHDDADYEELEVSAEDERMLSMFMSDSKAKRRTLADIIMEKIAEHEAKVKAKGAAAEVAKKRVHPKVQEVYSQVGRFLRHYTSGKVPKAFKIIPTMRNWEEILQLTSPESWTPQAMYVATRMFAGATSEKVAQRFYMLVLLPRVREDIEAHRRLNYHLYRAVKKAIFKPTAFFRGLMLPLAMDGCTVREAVIMSSILAKCSIPVLYASVAMMKLALMDYRGTETLFLKVLLNKKYNLPFRVVDSLVHHFSRFFTEERHLPVVWHQCLLTFVQRYKRNLTAKQIATIRVLTRKQQHHLVSAEIRRELASVGDKEISSGGRSRTSSVSGMEVF